MSEPAAVRRCRERALAAGFGLSCEPGIGRLLATLAAAVPARGRILELGTGAGVGLAWLLDGLGPRADVAVLSVESDPAMSGLARAEDWPDFVTLVEGDGAAEVRRQGVFDLVFADAPGGKLEGLDDTVACLTPGGVLVVDDMDPALHLEDGYGEPLARVRDEIMGDPRLVAAELAFSTWAIVATRRA